MYQTTIIVLSIVIFAENKKEITWIGVKRNPEKISHKSVKWLHFEQQYKSATIYESVHKPMAPFLEM